MNITDFYWLVTCQVSIDNPLYLIWLGDYYDWYLANEEVEGS